MEDYVGDRIRRARARLRMSQGELARRLAIRPEDIHAIELGSTALDATRLQTAAAALGVSTDWLNGREGDGGGKPDDTIAL